MQMIVSEPEQKILDWATKYNVTLQTEFVPFSRSSRNKAEEHKSLNWKVTLLCDGKPLLSTDYSAGIGNCPAYKASVKEFGGRDSLMRAEAINYEIENGKRAVPVGRFVGSQDARKIEPNLADVLYSLALDASVLDAGGFEQWAGEFDCDTDSRKAEKIYRDCLETALQLRRLGETALTELREACEGGY